MNSLFNMDNKFFVFMGKVADLIILNLLCVICCIPVITAGASITAMFYVTLKMVRNEESYIVKSFFKSFKENFKQATIINLIMLATGVMLFLDMNISRGMQGTLGKVLMFLFMVFVVLYAMIFTFIYPVLSKFYNTVRNTFVNAFLMSLRHLPFTFLMIIITIALPVAIIFIPIPQLQSMVFMLFFLMGCSTLAFINSKFLVKIFDNYIPKEEEAEELPESTDTPV